MFNRIDVGPGPPLGPSVSLKLYITIDIRASQEIDRSTEFSVVEGCLENRTRSSSTTVRNSYHIVHAYLSTSSSKYYLCNAKDYYWSGTSIYPRYCRSVSRYGSELYIFS